MPAFSVQIPMLEPPVKFKGMTINKRGKPGECVNMKAKGEFFIMKYL